MIMPAVFGYHNASSIADPVQAPRRNELVEFARREGFSLVQLFVETGEGRRVALESMIEAASYHEVVAIVVPGMDHLGRDHGEQEEVRRDVEEKAGVPVLAIDTA
jgi:Resolvase, N terminal domain